MHAFTHAPCTQGSKSLENSKRKIFIGGLPVNVSEQELVDLFKQYGPVSGWMEYWWNMGEIWVEDGWKMGGIWVEGGWKMGGKWVDR